MVTINIELIISIVTLLGIAVAVIGFMIKIWNNSENSIIKITGAVNNLANEVAELKGYGERITQNEKDILVIKKTCELYHKE